MSTVVLALDNDITGRETFREFRESLKKAGYPTAPMWPPDGAKDWNEALQLKARNGRGLHNFQEGR